MKQRAKGRDIIAREGAGRHPWLHFFSCFFWQPLSSWFSALSGFGPGGKGRAAALTLLLLPLFLWPLPALAAASDTVVGEEMMLTRVNNVLFVREQIVFSAPGVHRRNISLPSGYLQAQITAGGKGRPVTTGSGLQVQADPQVSVRYTLPIASNMVINKPVLYPTRQVAILAGPGVYPSAMTQNSLQNRGPVKVGGVAYQGFSAQNLSPGTPFDLGVTIGTPGAWVGNVILGILVLMGGGSIWLGARWLRRLQTLH